MFCSNGNSRQLFTSLSSSRIFLPSKMSVRDKQIKCVEVDARINLQRYFSIDILISKKDILKALLGGGV